MGFMTGVVDRQADGGGKVDELRPLKLSGGNGVLAKWLKSRVNVEETLHWKLTSDELCELAGESGGRSVVIPQLKGDPCLWELNLVTGESQDDLSSVLFQFKVHKLEGSSSPELLKLQGDGEVAARINEAFELTGGIRGGEYLWRAPKMNIGGAIVG